MASGKHRHGTVLDFWNFRAVHKHRFYQGDYWVSKLDNGKGLKSNIKWTILTMMIVLHFLAVVGVYQIVKFFWQNIFTNWVWVLTVILSQEILAWFSGDGVTMGAHRLWSHRTYEAHWIVRLWLVLGSTMSFQTSVLNWARDHRLHHKQLEEAGNPHDSTRGMFFVHIGWLLIEKKKEIREICRSIPVQDLYDDLIVKFNRDYYLFIALIVAIFVPYKIGIYLTNDPVLSISYFVGDRIVQIYHRRWVINLVAYWYVRRHCLRNMSPANSTRA